MNKKFLVGALLVALSTMGYAGSFTLPNESIGNAAGLTANVDKTNENFGAVSDAINGLQDDLAGKADANNVYSKEEADNKFVAKEDLDADFATQDELDSLKNQVGNNTAISTENSKLVGELKQENETQQEQIDKNTTDIEDIKENVYTKDEVNEALNGKVDQEEFEKEKDNIYGAISGNTTQITDEIKAREEADKNLQTQIDKNKEEQVGIDKTQDENLKTETSERKEEDKKLQGQITANKEAQDKNNEEQQKYMEDNREYINNLQQASNNHEARITHLEDRVDRLDEKMNEGLSLMAAMNAVDFQNVEAGEMAIGAGFGHYGNAQSVAVGVAYAPTDNFNVNVKYSATAGNPESFAIGAGASYKFKVGR